jgi:hypothetical protein
MQLRVYGQTDALTALGNELEHEGTARHLAVAGGLRARSAVLTGEVAPAAADAVLRHVAGTGIAERDIVLTRTDDIASPGAGGASASLIWADVLGQAQQHARPVARFPAAAYLGVAAGVGELDKAWGALAVLVVNVAMIQVGGAATLLLQAG